MKLLATRVALVAAVVLAFPVALFGQRGWAEPYRRGSEAVKDGRYAEGIPLLEKAISIDRRQARVKLEEGTFSTEYYPFYYLGVAYLRIGNLDKAEEAFNNAKVCRCLTSDLQGLLNHYEGEVRAERDKRNSARGAGGGGGRGDTGGGGRPPDKPNSAFAKGLDEANSSMGARRWTDALQQFDALRRLDAGEFGRLGLGSRRDEAARNAADELVRQGNQFLQDGQLTAASAKFDEANRIVPGSGQRGLDDILGRRNQYAKHKAGAEGDIRANRPEAAIEKLRDAQSADREQFEKDGFGARLQDLLEQVQGAAASQKVRDLLRRAQERAAAHDYRAAVGFYGQALNADPNNAEAKSWLAANAEYEKQRDAGMSLYKQDQLGSAREALENARRQNEERFTVEKLDRLIDEINKKLLGTLPEDQIAPVREALVAYLRGDTAGARTRLEAVLAREASLDPRVRAHVFAWLGVVYADLSITARAEAERADLRAKAIERFTQLLAAEPDYQLRDSLISPQIRDLLQAARSRR